MTKQSIDFFMHDAEGRILMSGNCPETELVLQNMEGATRRVGLACPGWDYFDGASVKPLPARPSSNHVFDYRSKQWCLDTVAAWAAIRKERDTKLERCDWTTLTDVPLSATQKSMWQAYRQALRDITLQSDPSKIVWPDSPTF